MEHKRAFKGNSEKKIVRLSLSDLQSALGQVFSTVMSVAPHDVTIALPSVTLLPNVAFLLMDNPGDRILPAMCETQVEFWILGFSLAQLLCALGE